MCKEEFVKLVSNYFSNQAIENNSVTKIIAEKETEDDIGDFIFEDNSTIIGKYYRTICIPENESADGKAKFINFCILSLARKDSEGCLSDIFSIDYMLL